MRKRATLIKALSYQERVGVGSAISACTQDITISEDITI